jgi:hypothetical protein
MGIVALASYLAASLYVYAMVNARSVDAAGPMLGTTTSRYMKTLDVNTLAMEGCNQGTASPSGEFNYVILDFGEPWWDPSIGGEVVAFDNNHYLDTSVASAVEAYANGVEACSDRKSGWLDIVIGTNNYGPYVTESNGEAWGGMALETGLAISAACDACGFENIGARADAGSDMELAWNTYAQTAQWASGRESGGGGGNLMDYGDAAGCPTAGAGTCCPVPATPTDSCPDPWTQQQVGTIGTQYIPEIYYSVNAQQWAAVVQNGCGSGFYSTLINGPLTEYAADSSTNTPQQAWSELWDDIAATCAGSYLVPLQASTDITWAN